MIKFIEELLGRDSHTKKIKALIEIERCRRSLSSIVSTGIIDKSFDEKRKILESSLDVFCSELRDKITYSNWWEDWETAIQKQRARKDRKGL
jgi:hypothetical protein